MTNLFLKKQEDRRIKAGHLWIYSNEIDVNRSPIAGLQPGQLTILRNSQGEALGVGYINPKTLLSFRLLSRSTTTAIDVEFFIKRFDNALALRERLFSKPFYRLVYGESDGLPGLVIDRFANVFVIQITTAGMELLTETIINALVERFHPQGILLKNDTSARTIEGLSKEVKIVYGEIPEIIIVEENGLEFAVSLQEGQKTGWYYDQRCNRAAIIPFVKGQRVLDVYSYAGGFGIVAAKHGASAVTCIDSSAQAIEVINKNAQLNDVNAQLNTIEADAFDALKGLRDQGERFDMVIVDPPAFIKKRKDVKEGTLAYQRLNHLAMQVLSEDGILVSASCSMHMSSDMLQDAIRRAGLKQRCQLGIIGFGMQGPDHPIHPSIPETFYLKAITCRVIADPVLSDKRV